MQVKIRLAVRNFFKKHGRKIIIGLFIWTIVLVINHFVGKWEAEFSEIQTNYEPHVSVLANDTVPKRLQTPIEQLIGEFVEKCNNKDYEAAYNLLSEECRNNVYGNIELFKLYVDSVFPNKKIFNIQNFSNKDDVYVYTITILNDILASGMNNEDDEETYSEKYVIKEENGELKLSIRQYIGREELTYIYEDEYMKIKIESVDVKYDNIVYNLRITNKSEYYLVFADYTVDYEISLDTSEGLKRRSDEVLEPITVFDEDTSNFSVKYTVFYDEDTEVLGMLFDYIRIYESIEAYENGEDPIDDFSVEIKF